MWSILYAEFYNYSQRRLSVANRLSSWHLFGKFLISFVNRSISFANQTQKAWNQSLSTTEFWKKSFAMLKVKFDQNLGKNKIYLWPIQFREHSHKIPPISNFEIWQTCNVFHHVFTLVLKIWLAHFKTGSHQTNQKLVKNSVGWQRLNAFDCQFGKFFTPNLASYFFVYFLIQLWL